MQYKSASCKMEMIGLARLSSICICGFCGKINFGKGLKWPRSGRGPMAPRCKIDWTDWRRNMLDILIWLEYFECTGYRALKTLWWCSTAFGLTLRLFFRVLFQSIDSEIYSDSRWFFLFCLTLTFIRSLRFWFWLYFSQFHLFCLTLAFLIDLLDSVNVVSLFDFTLWLIWTIALILSQWTRLSHPHTDKTLPLPRW